MLVSITFLKDYRCFKAQQRITFRPGVNLLVGDQGTGKSTVLQLVRDLSQDFKKELPIKAEIEGKSTVLALDFEKDSPRTKPDTIQSGHIGGVLTFWLSHGETVQKLLADIPIGKNHHILVLDEPDMALAIRSAKKLADLFREWERSGHQLLAAVHNKVVIEAFDEVLSLEHGQKWIKNTEFIRSHMED